MPELIDLVGVVLVWHEAILEGLAVLADIDGSTLDTIVVASSLID